MSQYKQKMNVRTGQFNLVNDDGILFFKAGVASSANLPAVGNTKNDARVAADTGHMYVWDGSAWQDQGDVLDVDWAALTNKPSSSVANIDDAVSKRHSSGSDAETATSIGTLINGATNKDTPLDADQIGLMDSGASNVLKKLSWANLKAAFAALYEVAGAVAAHLLAFDHTNIHVQNTDDRLDDGGANEVYASEIRTAIDTTIPGKIDKLSAPVGGMLVESGSANTIDETVINSDDVIDAIAKEHTQNTDSKLFQNEEKVRTLDNKVKSDNAVNREKNIALQEDYGRNFKGYFANFSAVTCQPVKSLGNGIGIFSPGIDGTITDGNYLLRTNDYGISWQPIDCGDLFDQSAGERAVVFADAGNGLVFASIGTEGVTNPAAVIKSDDYGLTWTLCKRFLEADHIINGLAYLENGILLAGTLGGTGKMYRSTDYGVNWTDLGDYILNSSEIIYFKYLGAGVVLAGTGQDLTDASAHIWKSTDYGATWVDKGIILAGETRIDYIEHILGDIVILGTHTTGHMFRSIDAGEIWTDLGSFASSDGNDEVLAITYCGNGIVLAGTGENGTDGQSEMYRSTDYGATWALIFTPTGDKEIEGMDYFGNGVLLAGTGYSGKIYRSTDYGLTWSETFIGLRQVPFGMIYLGNGIIVAGTMGGDNYILRSEDNGLTWKDLGKQGNAGNHSFINFEYCGNGTIIVGGYDNNKIFRSTDYGKLFTEVDYAMGTGLLSPAYLGNKIAMCVSSANGNVRKSIDSGLNWTDLGDITSSGNNSMCYAGDDIAVVGCSNGHIWRTIDGGANWSDLGDISTGEAITIMKNLGKGFIIAGTYAGGKVLRSTDYGATWADLGQIAAGATSIGAIDSYNNIVIAGTQGGKQIMKSIDYGATWTLMQTLNADILSVVISGQGDILVSKNGGRDAVIKSQTI